MNELKPFFSTCFHIFIDKDFEHLFYFRIWGDNIRTELRLGLYAPKYRAMTAAVRNI